MQIRDLRQTVAQNPIDTASRMSLAYLLMQSADYASALTQYQTVLRQDSLNVQAASGALWARSGLKDWNSVITESAAALKRFPHYAPILNHRAYAYLQKGQDLKARAFYNTAYKHADDPQSSAIASSGLAWSYLSLGDRYPAAHYASKEDSLFHQAFVSPRLSLSLDYSFSNHNLQSATLRTKLQSGFWALKLGAEELVISSKHYRYALSGGLNLQSLAGSTGFSYSYLDGDDLRAYPARSYSLSHSKAFYSGALSLKPHASLSYGSFQYFDTYQADLGCTLRQQKLSATLSYSRLYQDNDSAGADQERELISVSTHLYPKPGYVFSLYYTHGSQAWWLNPYGAVVDDFEAATDSYAISLYASLSPTWGITLYHQIGLLTDETRHLSNLAITYTL